MNKTTPSQELCKKLEIAGYPQKLDNHSYLYSTEWHLQHYIDWQTNDYCTMDCKAPTVAEMLELIWKDITWDGQFDVTKQNDNKRYLEYTIDLVMVGNIKKESLPDALAEMRILLKEKWFIK